MSEEKKEEKTVEQRLADIELAIRDLTKAIERQHNEDRQNLAKYLSRISGSVKSK